MQPHAASDSALGTTFTNVHKVLLDVSWETLMFGAPQLNTLLAGALLTR